MRIIIMFGTIVLGASSARAAEMPSLDPDQLSTYATVERLAGEVNVPRELALAIADVESGMRDVRSTTGSAVGPMQVHPSAMAPAEWSKIVGDRDLRVRRGLEIIALRLKQAQGATLPARMMYVCGRRFSRSCSGRNLDRIRRKWRRASSRWGVADRYPTSP